MEESEMIDQNLKELHDCERCHGKIVAIAIDKQRVTRCGYCGETVDYAGWFRRYTNFKINS